jgi:hypothetical protein
MKHSCKRTREKWTLYSKGALPDIREQQHIAEHLQACPACQAFAYGERLSCILQESSADKPPEPSAHFFTDLARKLRVPDVQERNTGFAEMVLDKGWRLVPAMLVAVFFLMGSIAYQLTVLSQLTAQSSFEEALFYEGALLEESDFLSAILGGGVINGNE